GLGRDWMRGGAGMDIFQFKAWAEIDWDALAEFESGVDRIDLSGLGVTIVEAFTGVAGQLVITGHAGGAYLYFDSNGDGVADRYINVTGQAPVAGDFILGPTAPGWAFDDVFAGPESQSLVLD